MTDLLEMRDVSVRFGGLAAVSNASLTIAPREVHALIGPNGAGKSTVINCISGFQRLAAGELFLNAVPLAHMAPSAVARRGIARTFQTPQLFGRLSVADNIRVAHQRLNRAETGVAPLSVEELVRLVGLSGSEDVPAERLAYGQQRLLEVARALATAPRLLLLDEPAAGLSSEEVDRLASLVRMIAGELGISVLFVEHNVPLVRRIADRITVMNHGLVIAAGAPEDVLADPAVITAYLGTAAVEH
ncbi:ABC transporter ATP-binding protein [Rhodoligotrophos ferricapiens]|uniref:ABC transporter ATP-binding protein n=1 Tax=Rhodoligotrophos ferricapiens TaxID=3069264 RepID=UPI00315D2ED4